MTQPFGTFFRELQARLGPEYGLWQEFAPKNIQSYLSEYTHVGVLYVDNGTLNILPAPMQGVNAQCTLALTMRLKEGQLLSDVVLEPLNVLVQGLNGKSVSSATDGVSYEYAIVASYPTSDGTIREGDGCYFVNVEINFSLTISSGGYSVYKGDGVSIRIAANRIPIGGIIAVTQGNQLTKETSTLINQGSNKNKALAKTWLLQVTAFYLPNDAGQQYLNNQINASEPTPFYIVYKGVSKRVYVESTVASERFQFEHITYDFYEAM